MGGGSSSSKNKLELEMNPDTKNVIRKLQLSPEDVDKFWKAFCQLDRSHNNTISLDEFQRFYQIYDDEEKIYFLKMAYSRDVTVQHREVNFCDYLSHTWDYLTLDLSTFLFQMYDKDGSGQLDKKEYGKIAETVYAVKFGHNHLLDNAIMKTDADGSGTISFDEFVALTKKDQNVNRHAFYIQDAMKQHIGGLHYWETMCEGRKKKFRNKTLHQILSS
jgi:Ca2+-binding EF-hand superfamily protein